MNNTMKRLLLSVWLLSLSLLSAVAENYPYKSDVLWGYLAALGRRCGPMWASAPTEVCCGRHRPAKMLRRGGACPRPRAATRAAPTSGVPSLAGYLAVLEACRGGGPHPPAGRSAGQGPRVRRYAVRGGAFISRGGNQNGKLYTALSPAPVGAGGQLPPHRLQRRSFGH